MTEVASLVGRLLEGDRRALARLLTLVEDGGSEVQREVIVLLHPHAGRARRIGVTGAPGVGKSSVTSQLVAMLRRRGRRVGVLAVDPSSPLTGGALLGDRIRMQVHHDDEGVFIRSMAARGHLGGMAAAVPAAALVLDAAGFDDVIVETVGVGQSEVDVAAMADATVVVLAPGFGDGVQAAKAGILEVADLLVVNKADQPGAGRLESELRGMVELGRTVAKPDRDGTAPTILRTVAVRGEGIEALCDAIDAHAHGVEGVEHAAGRSDAARERARVRRWIIELAAANLRTVLLDPDGPLQARLEDLVEAVVARALDPVSAADRLVGRIG